MTAVGRGRLPRDEHERAELTDLFGCLLDGGHTLEESVLFLLQVSDDDADARMRIEMVSS